MAKNTKEPSQRQLRVGEEIRHILADIILRGDFDATSLSNVSITVTEVDVGPDMRNAKVYVSALGGKVTEDDLVTILNKQAPQFTTAVAKKLTMKFTPRVKFAPDTRFDYANKIEALLDKVKKS